MASSSSKDNSDSWAAAGLSLSGSNSDDAQLAAVAKLRSSKRKRAELETADSADSNSAQLKAIAKLRAASSKDKVSGAAVGAALSAVLGCCAGELPASGVIAALRHGVESMEKHFREQLAAAMDNELNETVVRMAGVDVPQCCCLHIARFLPCRSASAPASDRAHLTYASKDWCIVMQRPPLHRSLAASRKWKTKHFVKLLQRPMFAQLRAVALPRIQSSKDLFSKLAKACPSLTALDARAMDGDGLKDRDLEAMKRLPLQILIEKDWAVPLPVAFTALSLLQGVSMSWYVATRSANGSRLTSLFSALGTLAQLKFLRIGQHHFKDELTSNFQTLDDAVFAPVARNCRRLRQLVLDSVFGIGAPTWQALRANAPHFESVLHTCQEASRGRASVPEGYFSIAELVQIPSLTSICIDPQAHQATVPILGITTAADIDLLLAWLNAPGAPGTPRKLMLPRELVGAFAQARGVDADATFANVHSSIPLASHGPDTSYIEGVVDGSVQDISGFQLPRSEDAANRKLAAAEAAGTSSSADGGGGAVPQLELVT